jgi:hypothetical protein
VLRVIANNAEVTLPKNDFALITHFSDSSSYFHKYRQKHREIKENLNFLRIATPVFR